MDTDELIMIEVIKDCDFPHVAIGDLDVSWNIHTIEKFLKRNGKTGKKQLIQQLKMIRKTIRKWKIPD